MADNIKITPPVSSTNNTQIEDIRIMMMDAAPADYSVVTNDYFFSDAEITDAMKRCVQAFNALPPISVKLNPCMIYNDYMFKVGTCWQLCLTKLLFYQRKSTQYTTGGVATDMYSPIINSLTTNRDMFKDEFISLATAQKRELNAMAGYGPVG